jgi:hypothetical protein
MGWSPPWDAPEMDFAWTHGWSGLMVAYSTVQGPMLAGLIKGRAAVGKYLTSPILAVPLTAIAGLTLAAVTPVLTGLGAAPHGLVHLGLGTLMGATWGQSHGVRR